MGAQGSLFKSEMLTDPQSKIAHDPQSSLKLNSTGFFLGKLVKLGLRR